MAAVWGAAGLKVIAAALPVLAAGRAAASGPVPWQRPLRVLAWAEAVILTLYGLVLTTVGLLVQSGLIRAGAGADHRALAWHAYLWGSVVPAVGPIGNRSATERPPAAWSFSGSRCRRAITTGGLRRAARARSRNPKCGGPGNERAPPGTTRFPV
jgi:hypothetical protein